MDESPELNDQLKTVNTRGKSMRNIQNISDNKDVILNLIEGKQSTNNAKTKTVTKIFYIDDIIISAGDSEPS